MADRSYLVSEGRVLHSCGIVATSSLRFPRFLSFLIEIPKPARRIRPSHELEGGADTTGSEELFGTSSVVQDALHAHESAWQNREGIGRGKGGEEREGRSLVQGEYEK